MEKLEAARLMMTAVCNMNCSYCYISKNSSLASIHQKIKEEFETITVLGKLKDICKGEELKYLELWGAEPTLHLEYFTKDLEGILNEFPNLECIMMSSNFATKDSVSKIIDMIEAINMLVSDEKELIVRIQISTDGPKELSEGTRILMSGEEAADIITENFQHLIESLADLKFKQGLMLHINFKPTVPIDKMRMMLDKDNFLKYWAYFDNMLAIHIKHPNKNIRITDLGFPSLVVPGNYTAQDGRDFARFIEYCAEMGLEDMESRHFEHVKLERHIPYLIRFRHLVSLQHVRRINHRSLGCGAAVGGIAIGLGKESHVCHRTYMQNHPEYVDNLALVADEYEIGRLKLFNKHQIVNYDNEEKFLAHKRVVMGTKHYANLAIGYIIQALKNLALVSQASEIYLCDDEFCKATAQFIRGENGCIVESGLSSGSMHLQPMSVIKIFGNGAMETLNRVYHEYVKRGIDI